MHGFRGVAMANWQSWAPLPWSAWPQVLTAVLAVPHTPGTGQVPCGATGLTSGAHEPACWREPHDWSCYPRRVSTSTLGPYHSRTVSSCPLPGPPWLAKPGVVLDWENRWPGLLWFWNGEMGSQGRHGSWSPTPPTHLLGTDPSTGEHCDLGIGQPGHSALRPAPLLVPAAPPQMHP